jgi:hypothetical protein
MLFPPSLVRIRIRKPGKNLRLWLPIFLLWPLVPIVTVFLVPFLLLKALLGGGFRRSWRIFRLWVQGLVVLCRLRRLHVEVEEPDEITFIAVY